MKKIYFEQDELTLMAIYSAQTKQENYPCSEGNTGRVGTGRGR